MKLSDFENNKQKCNVCSRAITAENVTEHVPCLNSAYGFDKELSFENLLGLFLANGWINGTYGQDTVSLFEMHLRELDDRLVTRDPVLKMVQYALVVELSPKEKPHKFKGEVEPTPDLPVG